MNNIFSNLPQDISKEIFEPLLSSKEFRLERIISTGQSTPEGDWYDQKENEWVILLKGEAGLKFEGESEILILKSGDYINIPAHRKHRVEWTSPDETTVWLAVHYKS